MTGRMRNMRQVYLAAQFHELHEAIRPYYHDDPRIAVTLDDHYAGELSIYAAVHNLTLLLGRVGREWDRHDLQAFACGGCRWCS